MLCKYGACCGPVWYMAYRIAEIPMTLNDLQDHSTVTSHMEFFVELCGTWTISAHIACRAVQGCGVQPLKIPRLRLRVNVGHRLLNLCDCDSVLSERCRQTNSTQMATNKRPGIRGLVYYSLSIISLCAVRLWKQAQPMRSPFLWQHCDSDSGVLKNDSDSGPGLESRLRGLRLRIPGAVALWWLSFLLLIAQITVLSLSGRRWW